jgi:hypothetical protein
MTPRPAGGHRRALAERLGQGARVGSWFYTVLLAGLEAETLSADSALARIDEGLALARQVENRCNLAFPHLLRGELLLKRDPTNPAPAEEAFQTALAIAKQQGARSWGLRAALSLGKLLATSLTPTPSSRPRSKALRRRRKCRRSPRRRCWSIWRRAASGGYSLPTLTAAAGFTP